MEELVQIRELEIPDIPLVKQLFRENLWILDRLIFTGAFNSIMKDKENGAGTSFIAIMNDRVVGSISVRLFEIKGEKHGLIDSVVTARQMHGKGIAGKILSAVISWLESANCRHIYATVDRYNSRSWNMFIHNGFSLFEFPAQMKVFGADFFKVWAREGYFFGIGLNFIKKQQPGHAIEESGQLYHHCLGFAGFLLPWFFLALWGGSNLAVFPYLVPLALISFTGHEYIHALIANLFGLKTYFKANEPGILFFLALSLFGGIYPFYGSTYIREKDWSYVSLKNSKANGLIYFFGPITSIAIALLFNYLAGISEGYWQAAFSIGVFINVALAVANLLPLSTSGGFPFDGTKIYRWNKGFWLLAVAIVALSVYFTF
jgi:Zn-dependent protease/RimJ/RimL family protein N-acetyltransferase